MNKGYKYIVFKVKKGSINLEELRIVLLNDMS